MYVDYLLRINNGYDLPEKYSVSSLMKETYPLEDAGEVGRLLIEIEHGKLVDLFDLRKEELTDNTGIKS